MHLLLLRYIWSDWCIFILPRSVQTTSQALWQASLCREVTLIYRCGISHDDEIKMWCRSQQQLFRGTHNHTIQNKTFLTLCPWPLTHALENSSTWDIITINSLCMMNLKKFFPYLFSNRNHTIHGVDGGRWTAGGLTWNHKAPNLLEIGI